MAVYFPGHKIDTMKDCAFFLFLIFPFLFCSGAFAMAKKPSPSIEELQPPTQGPSLGILPSARPCPPLNKNSGAPYISASYIYWQGKMGGLEYAAKNKGPVEIDLAHIQYNTHTIQPDFAWHPGYRAQLGWHLPYDGWDLEATYTYFIGRNSHIKKKALSQLSPSG